MFIELHLLPDEENEPTKSVLVNIRNISFVEEFSDSCQIFTNHGNIRWIRVQESYDTVKRLIREATNNVRNK